jgi:hypothetical protein
LVPRGTVPVSPHHAIAGASIEHRKREIVQRRRFRTEAAEMKTLIIPGLISALALTVVHSAALAAPGSASGPSALALAAVIAQHSPAVRAFDAASATSISRRAAASSTSERASAR